MLEINFCFIVANARSLMVGHRVYFVQLVQPIRDICDISATTNEQEYIPHKSGKIGPTVRLRKCILWADVGRPSVLEQSSSLNC